MTESKFAKSGFIIDPLTNHSVNQKVSFIAKMANYSLSKDYRQIVYSFESILMPKGLVLFIKYQIMKFMVKMLLVNQTNYSNFTDFGLKTGFVKHFEFATEVVVFIAQKD